MRRDPEPIATYRLQLGPDRSLDAASGLVPYLASLGISHLYLSPIFEAVPGSTHGYDVTDPTRVRGELGGRPALERLRDVLDHHGLGLVLDIVPNHQAVHADNPLWWSLLRDGPDGPAGTVFDVDWGGGPHHPAGSVLLPVLGAHPSQAIAAGDLRLDGTGEEVVVRYHDQCFPLRPGTVPPSVREAPGRAVADGGELEALLARQWYRLAHWRAGQDDLSHRRFFDVTGLVGVRVEDPEVFDRTHALIIELVHEGVVQGLRVDHIDGLADPDGYLDRLAAVTDGAWVLVEKILERGERLPSAWSVDGTTGYEGGALVTEVLHDPTGAPPLVDLFEQVTGDTQAWPEQVACGKRAVLDRLFQPEQRRLLDRAVAALATVGVDADEGSVAEALRELIVSLVPYRTYPPPSGPMGTVEAAVLETATRSARAACPARAELIGELARVLLEGGGGNAGLELRRRFNQVTGAVTAKGVEDTALYRWIPLPGAGDVGAAPHPLGRSLEDFHATAARSTAWPQGLVAASTHDSKRGEDVRARLAVLGEASDEWAAAVRAWNERLGRLPVGEGAPPDGLAALTLWQSLLGAWPIDEERTRGQLRKAMREAKRSTSWTDPDEAYEAAVDAMVAAVFAAPDLLAEVASFVDGVDGPGRVNALAQLLLRLTLPGIPDVYQGNELWRHDLTDPDNRRSVDFDRRRCVLDAINAAAPGDVWPDDGSGRAKMWLLHRALAVRRRHGEAFLGPYAPLSVTGPTADHVVAYLRGDQVVTVVPRFPIALARAGGLQDTEVRLPAGRWVDALDHGRVWEGAVGASELLAPFPVALLVRTPGPAGV